MPSGITITEDWQWSGPATQRKKGLKIEISQEVKPGEYAFNMNGEVDGKGYGAIPCVIEVLE